MIHNCEKEAGHGALVNIGDQRFGNVTVFSSSGPSLPAEQRSTKVMSVQRTSMHAEKTFCLCITQHFCTFVLYRYSP